MQAVLRETIARHLLEVPPLMTTYQRRDPVFTERSLKWFSSVEEELAKLRHPLTASVSAKRGLILATLDGMRRPELEQTTSRKRSRAATAVALAEVETLLRQALEGIDQFFSEMTEKMAQLLAVASTEHPLPLPPTEPRDAWLGKVWNVLATGNGTGMYHYLNARLTRVDRFYVLDQILTNMLDG